MGLYVAAAVVALVIVNADQSDVPAAAGITAAAALALGWGTGSGWGAVVAWILIPLALPFGDTNQLVGGDHTDSVALLAVVSAVVSTVLIMVAAGARVLYNRHRLNIRAGEAGEVELQHSPSAEAGEAGDAGDAGTTQPPDPPNTHEPGRKDAGPINSPPAAPRR